MKVPIAPQSTFPVFMASVIFTDMSYLAKFVPLSWVPKESGGGGGGGGLD